MDSRGRVRSWYGPHNNIMLLTSAGVEVGWVRVEIYHTLRLCCCACVRWCGPGVEFGGLCVVDG